MAAKTKALTEVQKKVIRDNGLKTYEWVVLQDLTNSMIVRHRITGEVRVLEK